jgi:hypothetical protein
LQRLFYENPVRNPSDVIYSFFGSVGVFPFPAAFLPLAGRTSQTKVPFIYTTPHPRPGSAGTQSIAKVQVIFICQGFLLGISDFF